MSESEMEIRILIDKHPSWSECMTSSDIRTSQKQQALQLRPSDSSCPIMGQTISVSGREILHKVAVLMILFVIGKSRQKVEWLECPVHVHLHPLPLYCT